MGRLGSWGIVAVGLLSVSAYAVGTGQIETIQIPEGRDSPSYRLQVEGNEHLDEPDDNRRLTILAGGRRTAISFEGGLATVRDSVEPRLLARNALPSKFVFRASPMPNNMIMAFGYAFEPGPGPMRIFRLNATSSPEQILSEETFQLTDVRKGASGRSLLVIGRRSFSQRSGECLSTYDPYAVFKVTDEAKGRFEYALALSKEYNLAHYAGWAGPDSDERIPVDICRNRIRIIRP